MTVEIDVRVLGRIINTLRECHTALGDIVNADDNGDPYKGGELQFALDAGNRCHSTLLGIGVPDEKIVYPWP